MRPLAALAILTCAGCVPAVRAGAYYQSPLYEPARSTTRTPAAYRVVPPPEGCSPVAPPILLLPALGFTGESWAEVATLLKACRARVLVDIPGIGESRVASSVPTSEVVSALRDIIQAEAGGRPVVLVGNSIGGMLSPWIAARAPDEVAGIVLVDAPVIPYPLSSWEKPTLHPVAFGPLIRAVGPYLAERLALPPSALAGRTPSPWTVALTVEQTTDSQRRLSMRDYHFTVASPRELAEERTLLPRLHMPILIIWGDQDRIASPSLVAPIAATFGGPVEHVILHGVGHLPPLEVPAEVARLIDAFVATLPPVAAAAPEAAARRRVRGVHPPGTLIYGARREWFPVLGGAALFSRDARADLAVVAGVARGAIDAHYPLETGRLVWTAGVGFDNAPASGHGWQFGYLRTTLRLELVWRWAGGVHLDGTLLVDPVPEHAGHVGGFGALGYAPSVIPWVRGFVGYGSFPQASAGVIVGVELDVRLTGWLY
jgi:pimeloyl-ACP methyl ester carboxylesterase